MNEEFDIVLKWAVGIFIGVMLWIFLTQKDAMNFLRGKSPYPSTAAPAPTTAYSTLLNATLADACGYPENPERGLIAPANCAIPLNVCYLTPEYAPGYAPVISPVNLGQYCCYYGGEQIMPPNCGQAACEAAICGADTVTKPIKQLPPTSCNPDIGVAVPGTETV